jgi:hypothetical protein
MASSSHDHFWKFHLANGALTVPRGEPQVKRVMRSGVRVHLAASHDAREWSAAGHLSRRPGGRRRVRLAAISAKDPGQEAPPPSHRSVPRVGELRAVCLHVPPSHPTPLLRRLD